MSPVVYFHVGAPKTGTTYLQDRLERNRGSLAKHGVHYPLGVHASHFRAALDLIDLDWGGQREQVRGEWDRLMDKVRSLEGTVIVSHEILAGATPEQVSRAMSAVQGCEVHVVYSARDLARQIPAEWQEGVKHRRRRSFARFCRLVQQSPQRRPRLWFWRVQGLVDVLTRWGQHLPPERIHLVTVPQAGAPRDLLWERYCEAFGIDPAWAPREGARENVSIGVAETALLRRINRRLKAVGYASSDYRAVIRQRVVHETLALRADMTRVTLPPQAHPWAAEVAQSWVAWVRRRGLHVVGDLDDLLPRPPAPDEPWHDPDHPQQREMLDAALDAVVALAQHSARRSVRERLTRQGRRVLRRLRRP